MPPITVVLADDNLIVREGVRALLSHDRDVEVVGVAGDYDELVAQAIALKPQVVVTDIRMPPTFSDEGIEAAKEVRKRLPGTGIVVLCQYDSPEYADQPADRRRRGVRLPAQGSGRGSGRLGKAIREVATGGSMLDPEIVAALVAPARTEGVLSESEETCFAKSPKDGRSKRSLGDPASTPEAVDAAIEAAVPAPGARRDRRAG